MKPTEADTKPTYEELEAQLNKLKADYQELDDEFEETHKRHCQARKAMERYQAEFLDMRRDRDSLATNYQRECERNANLRDRVKDLETRNQSVVDKLTDKIIQCQELEAKLQNCISEEDHEREIKEWETAFEAERNNRMEQTRLATKYHQWFEEAHAERLKLKEASQ